MMEIFLCEIVICFKSKLLFEKEIIQLACLYNIFQDVPPLKINRLDT